MKVNKVIGIIGTRSRDTAKDYQEVYDEFKKHYEPGDTICSGGCPKGGDRFAEIIMNNLGLPENLRIIHYPEKPPKGSPYYAYVKANYERNKLIAKDSDIIIACGNKQKDGGTENTIKEYKKLGKKKVYVV